MVGYICQCSPKSDVQPDFGCKLLSPLRFMGKKTGKRFLFSPPPPPPPSIFFFLLFFCSRSNNSTGNACYAGYPAIETSNWCFLIGPFIRDELRKSTKAVVAENFNLDLAFIRQLEQVYAPTGCYSRTHHHGQSHRGGIFEFEFKQNLRYREPLPYYCVSLSPSQLLRDFTVQLLAQLTRRGVVCQ